MPRTGGISYEKCLVREVYSHEIFPARRCPLTGDVPSQEMSPHRRCPPKVGSSTCIRKLCIIKYNFDRSAFLPFMDEIITEVYKLMQVSDHMLPVRTFERQIGDCKDLFFLCFCFYFFAVSSHWGA